MIYAQKKNWKSIKGLSDDLRIELEDWWSSDISILESLAADYPNNHVKGVLSGILRNISVD